MIKVTRLNGQEMVLNADFIERVEGRPDTIITLTTGEQFIARESVDEIVGKVKDYKRSIAAPLQPKE
ncbi:MAG TPA: flagellar FlbD family protein [bacterium]|nr:flagellar FlbD family protein [bacterium]HPJ71446.1 flagellar FlbD family protein [bacterium]HPQ66737.1 flagellar FlbD family protein [bacterium]